MILSHAKIGTKLYVGFSAVLIPLVLVAAVGLRGMSSSNSDLVKILTNENGKVSLANDMINQINVIARAERNVVLSMDEKLYLAEKQRMEGAQSQFAQAYQKLSGMI